MKTWIQPTVKFNALARIERNARRAGEIIGVLAKYGLADWVKGWNYSWIQERIQSDDGQRIPDLKIEERVRLAFTELGTTFIKLGQVLSTRPDLVGPEMARELAHLQTDTPADPPETVRATIEAEFGKPLDKLFAQFDDDAPGLGLHRPGPSGPAALGRGGRRQGPARRHCGQDHARPRYSGRAGRVGGEALCASASLPARARSSGSSAAPCCASWISPSNAAIWRSSRNTFADDPPSISPAPTRRSRRAAC